ncbi:hypothetical protein ON010_g3700 [Phytophthora cinnamomi]|nr:hypothetical protein ON010_g3700 [Phytophthora cinnamomi]
MTEVAVLDACTTALIYASLASDESTLALSASAHSNFALLMLSCSDSVENWAAKARWQRTLYTRTRAKKFPDDTAKNELSSEYTVRSSAPYHF